MTVSELKTNVERSNPMSVFFTRNNMKFSGDTMKNYGVSDCGTMWKLYRKQPVKFGLRSSVYFDKVSFFKVRIPLT